MAGHREAWWLNTSTGDNFGAGGAQKFTWKLAYKTTGEVKEGANEGWSSDTVNAAFRSCDKHDAAIRYDVGGKPHSYYRRTHGPDTVTTPLNPKEWDKSPTCGQCDGFDAFELMSGCWRSKQSKGAGNKIGDDFQMFSTEKDFSGRTSSGGIGGGWTFCNYDDCPHHVGFPRDCGPTKQTECKHPCNQSFQ